MFQVYLAPNLDQPFPQEALVPFNVKWHLGIIKEEDFFAVFLGDTS